MRSTFLCLLALGEASAFSILAARPAALRVAQPTMRMPWEPVETADGEDAPKEEKKSPGIDFSGLAQLVTMGAGAPMLGDLKKVNLGKPEAEGGAADGAGTGACSV